MSATSVAILLDRDAEKHFAARERGNYYCEDTSPVADKTEISIDLGEDVTAYMTVAQWRSLVAAVNAGIEAIPAKRDKRIEGVQRAAARRAEREAASA